MDPRSGVQDVDRCDLCETTVVNSFCDFCQVNLCTSCIGDHISDGYHKHAIVPFQERRSTLIYPKCGTHKHKHCEFQCKDCDNILVCSSCMISEKHERHKFVEVIYEYERKKEIIEKDKDKLERHIYPKYEEIANDLENQLSCLIGVYEKLTTEMFKQGEEWHRKIDIVINKMKNEIGEIKVKHKDILQKHLDEIKQIKYLISQTSLVIKEIEKSTEISPIIEYSSKIGEFSKLSPKAQVSLPTFIPKPIDSEKLHSVFGQITPLCTALEDTVLIPKEIKNSFRVLLDEPELVTVIQTGHEKLRCVTSLNDDQIWISAMTNDTECFNMRGLLLQTILTKSGDFPLDVDVDSDGNLLYLDWKTGQCVK